MNQGAIVFPMANPTPEIMPDEALAAGAAVVGTGRSDFPNQINNVLAFPGYFQGCAGCYGDRHYRVHEDGSSKSHRKRGKTRAVNCPVHPAAGI